jgi:hypothetical protein
MLKRVTAIGGLMVLGLVFSAQPAMADGQKVKSRALDIIGRKMAKSPEDAPHWLKTLQIASETQIAAYDDISAVFDKFCAVPRTYDELMRFQAMTVLASEDRLSANRVEFRTANAMMEVVQATVTAASFTTDCEQFAYPPKAY